MYRFGHGLSYTTFEYQLAGGRRRCYARSYVCKTGSPKLVVDAAAVSLADPRRVVASVSAVVRNSGDMDGDEVVLAFLSPPNAGVDGAPLQSLFAFQRVHVQIGAEVTVDIDVTGARHNCLLHCNVVLWTVRSARPVACGRRRQARCGGGRVAAADRSASIAPAGALNCKMMEKCALFSEDRTSSTYAFDLEFARMNER